MLADAPATGEDLDQPTSQRLIRLLDYWHAKRGSRRFPSRADLDPLDFRYMLGDVALVDVIGDPPQFRFRLYGSHLVERLGTDLTGKTPGDHPDPVLVEFMDRTYRQVVAERRPTMSRRRAIGRTNRAFHYEILRLPLSADGEHVNMLLIALEFTDQPSG